MGSEFCARATGAKAEGQPRPYSLQPALPYSKGGPSRSELLECADREGMPETTPVASPHAHARAQTHTSEVLGAPVPCPAVESPGPAKVPLAMQVCMGAAGKHAVEWLDRDSADPWRIEVPASVSSVVLWPTITVGYRCGAGQVLLWEQQCQLDIWAY